MPWTSKHLDWLIDLKKSIKTSDGKEIQLFKFSPDFKSTAVMSEWAKHFRNHYCFDTEIDFLREGTPHSRKEYLLELKFPTDKRGFGPGIRSGDFAEILVSDYLEYIMQHYVPRTRYGNKVIRDESSKGSDLIGFMLFDDKQTANDILTIFEVKAQLSGDKPKPRLQDAIDDSGKDEMRKAESLNAIKQRLMDKADFANAKLVSRFQDPLDKPYKEQFGAAALFSTGLIDENVIKSSIAKNHPKHNDLTLIVISADDCMKLVNELYEIAADEA